MELHPQDFQQAFIKAETGELRHWVPLVQLIGSYSEAMKLEQGVEERFAKRLADAGRADMTFIETGESFAQLLDAVPAADLALAEIVLRMAEPTMKAEMALLHSAWSRSDEEALIGVQKRSPIDSIPSFRKAFFAARNEAWAGAISARKNSEKRQLFVVGCLHLVGADKLQDMLSRQGLQVTPVSA